MYIPLYLSIAPPLFAQIALDLDSSHEECTLSADITPTEWIICNMAEQPDLPPPQHATFATLSERIPQLKTSVVITGPSTLLLSSNQGMFHVSGYFKYEEAALESLREMELDSSEEDSDS